MDLADPTAVALAIADVLRREGLPHALYGGLLLAAYGEARETRDADVAVAHGEGGRVAEWLERHLRLACRPAFERQRFGGVLVSRIGLVEGDEFNTLDLVALRERDVADAASVLRSIGPELDPGLLEREIGTLSESVPDHPTRERWERALAMSERSSGDDT